MASRGRPRIWSTSTRAELDSGGAAAATMQSRGATPLGGAAELALGCNPLEAPDSAAALAMAPLVHLVLPKEHAILLVPGDDAELEPRVPSMQALQLVREMAWRSLAARTRAHTPLASAFEAVPLGAVHHGPPHRNMLRARDGRLSTMQVMRQCRQKLTRVAIPAQPCIFCGGPEEDIGHMRLLCARDEEVPPLLCKRVVEFTASYPGRTRRWSSWRGGNTAADGRNP